MGYLLKKFSENTKKIYSSLIGQKSLLRINTMIKKLLDEEVLKKKNRLKNKFNFDFYGKVLGLKEELEKLEVAKREITGKRKGFLT